MIIEEEVATLRDMILNMQIVIEKTSETLQTMYEVLSETRDRIKLLEEKE